MQYNYRKRQIIKKLKWNKKILFLTCIWPGVPYMALSPADHLTKKIINRIAVIILFDLLIFCYSFLFCLILFFVIFYQKKFCLVQGMRVFWVVFLSLFLEVVRNWDNRLDLDWIVIIDYSMSVLFVWLTELWRENAISATTKILSHSFNGILNASWIFPQNFIDISSNINPSKLKFFISKKKYSVLCHL